MNVSFIPYVTQNSQSTNAVEMRKNNVQFTGALGDKFVREVETVVTPDIMKELKGTFGLKTERVEDVIESFVDAMRDMIAKGKVLRSELNSAKAKIDAFPKQKDDAVFEAEQKLRGRFMETISAKDAEIRAAKEEAAEARTLAGKYKAVVGVKPVEEIATVMPERALEIVHELVEHKALANKSMFDFLMTGKGQEEAIAQIERNNTLLRANADGIMGIPSVKTEYEALASENRIHYADEIWFTTNLIRNALFSDPRGEYLGSRAIREQVKKNAMAILTPMADERYSNTGIAAIEKELDKTFDKVIKFHEGFTKGLAKYKKTYNGCKDYEAVVQRVENDVDASKVIFKYTDEKGNPISWECTFDQVSDYGNSSWS